MRFLVTGARAPAALQWMRILGRSGHEIILADSLLHAVAYRSKWATAHVVLPSPARQFAPFAAAAKTAISQYQPEAIICTCEEIFYWAKAAELDPAGFAPYFRANPPFKVLRVLHHKGAFARLARSSAAEAGVHVPETRRFGELDDATWVCKPAYSRFAVMTRLGLSAVEAQVQLQQPGWLAQRQIAGREFCTWALFVQGREVCSAAYQPIYRAGMGSGIGLRTVEAGRAIDFARVLAARLRYTGQLAFDWMENDAGCHVLECNPRSTSGIHFLDSHSKELGRAIGDALHGRRSPSFPGAEEDLAVKWAMLLFGSLRMVRPRTGAAERAFFRHARDVERDPDDPNPARLVTLLRAFAEIVGRAMKLRSNLLRASTADIEWNGNRFWETPPGRRTRDERMDRNVLMATRTPREKI